MYREIRDGRTVRVRKPHACEWCGGRITPGFEAISRVYVWDRNLVNAWQHIECYVAMDESADMIDDGFTPGSFRRGKPAREEDL
jgi:hypothetical protein